MLRRIKPDIHLIENSEVFTCLPNNWAVCRLEDIVTYEQPSRYIVKSTKYSDEYKTPVLTAGKSFILGYTNETTGIYDDLPVIIFDDFTTESKVVDFKFKVKSSAMKILKVIEGIELEYVAAFMSVTRLLGETHKRFWISEYSKLEIPIPPIYEQKRIVAKLNAIFKIAKQGNK
jgi:type I restriction enzyme S subunit